MRVLVKHPILTTALVSCAVTLIVALVLPWPVPQFHDEFSYLLAGDTFAHGRLTNPPHAMPEFFETFQELSRPTYMSKYPPAQGMFLALGQVAFGRPIAGVWISIALASAACAWMLRAVLPKRWAMIGGCLAALHPLVLQWNWSYWGGAVAMLGGALLIGAAVRAARRPTVAHGAIIALALGILANSRPFEGAITSILVLGWLTIRLARKDARAMLRVAVATAICFAPIALWMGYYNVRITGSVFQFPYTLYEKQYTVAPQLAWMPRATTQPTYTNNSMREYYLEWELPRYEKQLSPRGFISQAGTKLGDIAWAYAPFPAIALSLVGLFVGSRSRATRIARWLAVVCVIVLLNDLPVLTFFPHYLAPIAAAMWSVVVVGLRSIWTIRRHLARATVLLVMGGQIFATFMWIHRMHDAPRSWNHVRAELSDDLARDGSRHLIFVRPGEGYYTHNEWVYNAADIDASSVIWARDRGDAENARLIDYYRSRNDARRTHLLTIGSTEMQFKPYDLNRS